MPATTRKAARQDPLPPTPSPAMPARTRKAAKKYYKSNKFLVEDLLWVLMLFFFGFILLHKAFSGSAYSAFFPFGDEA